MLLVAATATVMSLNAQTIVINEGFENGIQDSLWTQEFVSGHTAWSVESTADGLRWPDSVVQGSKRAYLRNTTGETQGYVTRLVSRVVDLSPRKVYQPELTFWYANPRWTADRDTLRVLYRTSENEQWKRMAEYSNGVAMWQKVSITLPEVGPTYQIAFEGTDNLGRGIVLDSILLRSAPECTIPHDLYISNRGANSVNVSWTASFDAGQFEVVISRDTINPDSLEYIPEELIAAHVFVTGLTRNQAFTLESDMSYLVYVRSLCSKEVSEWSSRPGTGEPYGFMVRPTEQVPYSCDFAVPSAKKNNQWLEEWYYGNSMGTQNPYMNSKVTSATTLGYYSYNKSTAMVFSGGTNASTPIGAGNYVFAATPALADTTNDKFHINQCQVHFWSTVYTYTGRQYGRSLIVGIMDDPSDITTFTPVDTVTVWGNKTFQENIVSLESYRGNGAYVAFVSDFDRPNLFYIDDVSIEYRPEVNKVTKISVNPRDTFATISWEGNAPSYNVLITNAEVDPSNPTAAAVVDQATVTGNSYRCEALEADHSWNAPYYVYVQAEGKEWSYRYPFVTIAAKREIPYTFDFESISGRYKSGSTYYIKSLGIFGNNSAYPYQGSENNYLGSNCLYLNKNAGTDAWVTFPMVEDIDSVQVKFYLSGANTYNQAHAQVGVMTNPMDINTFVPVADFTLNTTGYSMCYANFEKYSGSKDCVIAIVWGDVMNMSKNTINYIDNVTIEKLSDCVPPTNIRLSPEATSVNVSWDASKADTWEVLITRTALTNLQKEQSFAQLAALSTAAYADTVYWSGANDPAFNFEGLKSQTSYYFYVRTLCDGDMAWWTEIPFETPCPNYEFPYKETFESYASSSSLIGCWLTKDYLGTGYPMISTSGGSKSLELWSTGTTHRNVAIMPTVEGNLSDMLLCFDVKAYSSYNAAVLFVGTMGDINDQSTFVPFDTVRIAAYGGTSYVRLKLEDYNLAYDNIAFSSGLGNSLLMNSDVLLDNVELKDPHCLEPYNFAQTEAHEDEFVLTWDGEAYNDAWEVKVFTKDVTLANNRIGSYTAADVVIADSILTGKTLRVSGLKSLKTYYVYVRGLCGDSLWVKTSVETSCPRLDPAKANKETFESYSAGSSYSSRYQANCWISGNLDSSAESAYLPFIYSTSTYASSGTHVYRVAADYYYDDYYYGYTDELEGPAYLISPEIKCDSLSEVALTFSYAGLYSSYVIVGVMTNPNDFSTFVALDSIRTNSTPTSVTLDLSEAGYASLIPASARYIAWRTPYDAYAYVYIDDVSVTSLACPLTKPDVSEVTYSTARVQSGLRVDDVNWVLLVTTSYISVDNLADSNYVIPANKIVYLDTVSTRTQVIGGLEPQTIYYVATAAVCDSVVSLWNTMAFRTPCMAQTPEDFGTIVFSTAQGYSAGTSGYMPCWTVGSRSAAATASYKPYVNNSVPHNGHNYLQLADDVTSDHSYVGAYAIMPELDVDNISRYQIKFWGRGYNSSYTSYNCQVIVGIVSDPSDLSTFTALDTVTMVQSQWEPYEVAFDEYEGDFLGRKGRNIMFLSDFGITNYAYITDITIEEIPACRQITTFTVDSVGENAAVVSWRGHQDSYRLLVADRELTDEQKPAYHYLIDSVVDHSNHVRIENLKSATSYYIYAQGMCSESEYTDVSYRYAFVRTECPEEAGVSLPFSDDFESYESGDKSPGCWIFANDNSTSYPVVQSLSGGTNAVELYTPNYTSGGHSLMVVPKLANNLIDLQLSFDARAYGSYSGATLYIGTMSDPDDLTTFSLFRTINLSSTNFTHYTMDLADYNLLHEYLAFTSGLASMTASSSSDLYIDNITLEVLSTCHPPKLEASHVSHEGFTVNLTPNNAAHTAWELAMLPDSVYSRFSDINVYLDTTTHTVVTSDLQVSFSGLTSATGYCVFARTLCGGEEGNSAWSREPLRVNTRFYYKNEYFFGFEKDGELWERSRYSSTNNYYIHAALETGRDTLGAETDTYLYYPYSIANNSYSLFSHTGTGALNMYGSNSYYGGYVIFPAVETSEDRSFEFKIRSGYISATTYRASVTSDAIMEIGLVDKNSGFSNYETMATIRLDALGADEVALEENDFLFRSFTFDLTAETLAEKQVVFHLPQQSSPTVSLYLDNVRLDKAKGYSLVSIRKIEAEGDQATIEWDAVGGPWDLEITTTDEQGNTQTVASYSALTTTSQLVTGLTPRTAYMATLTASNTDGKGYEISTRLAFETTCIAMEPDADGAFVWDFDSDWEPNDILQGAASDSAYLKPACFTVGNNMPGTSNGAQWLIQRKGYEYWGPLGSYDSNRHVEVGRNDSHSLRVSSNTVSAGRTFIVLPELNCGYDTMMIEFYGRCFANYDDTHANADSRGAIVSTSYLVPPFSQSIVVGALDNPYDFSTLQVIDTLSYRQTSLNAATKVTSDPTGLRYWELMQLPLTGMQGKYIVLFQPAQGLFFIDDLAIKPIGNTIFMPGSARTADVDATSATLAWNPRHPSFESVVVLLNADGAEIMRDTVVASSYTLSELAPATNYSWYVYQTNEGVSSVATPAIAFITECAPMAANYTAGFELADGWKAVQGQTSDAYKQTLCWTYGDAQRDSLAAAYDPYNQPNTDLYAYSKTDSFALVMRALYSTYALPYQPYAAMPEMDVNAYDTLQITFWMRPAYVRRAGGNVATAYTGTSYSKSVIVGTMTDPNDASTFVAIDTVTYDGTLSTSDVATEANHYLFQRKKVDLIGATGPYIAFMTSFYEKGSDVLKTNDYIWIDDVALIRAQDCKDPRNLKLESIASTAATLSWDDLGLASDFRLQVSTDPYFADPDLIVFDQEVHSNPFTVTGLQPQTTYAWRVQSLCGEKEESEFSSIASFATTRSPFFVERFETSSLDQDWIFSTSKAEQVVDSAVALTSGTNARAFRRITNSYGFTTPHYVVPGYSGDYNWLVTPNLYLPEEDSVHLSLDIALTALNTAHTVTNFAAKEADMAEDYSFMIIVSDDGGKTWKSENILAEWQNNGSEGLQLSEIPTDGMSLRYSLAQYAGRNIRVGFYREAITTVNTGVAIHLDNIRFAYFDKIIESASACQYEDVQIGDIYLSGDDTQPGLHSYPTPVYVTDEEASAGTFDQVYALEIEVYPSPENIFTEQICEGETFSGYDFAPRSKTGTYRRKLASAHSCDSIVTLHLIVQPKLSGEVTEAEICPGEPYSWHGNEYTRAGLYRDTLISSLGCDSIETLVITYANTDVETLLASSTITEDELPFSYYDFNHPYMPGQSPIYYKIGTPPGEYKDTVLVSGEACTTMLIHTLTIVRHEAIDFVGEPDARGARKVIIRDQMYIILNDEWYTPSGQKVADPR